MTIEKSTNEAPRATTPGVLRPRILSTPAASLRKKFPGARAQFISSKGVSQKFLTAPTPLTASPPPVIIATA